MESGTCEKCGKVIEGFTQKNVDSLMAQHMIKHQNEEKEKERRR